MSGPRDPQAPEPPDRDPTPDQPSGSTSAWPERDLQREEPLETLEDGWDPRLHGERRRPTFAEQAGPWLVAVILALAGLWIVLLTFALTNESASGTGGSPFPLGSSVPRATSKPTPPPTATRRASPAPTARPSGTPRPTYGPLEMIYLSRATVVSPIELWRHDFSTRTDPAVIATAAQGILNYAWAADGRRGAALIGSRLVSIEAGKGSRALADGISSVTFGADSQTVYAVRIVSQGNNDRADVLQISFASGAARSIGSITYPHPLIGAEEPVKEAQFADEGGAVRIYALTDGRLGLWILGPGAYLMDPTTGTSSKVASPPRLFSPDQTRRVEVTPGGQGTVLVLRDQASKALATTVAQGLVSHVRWSPNGSEIVFTVGIASGGGVRQDLYVWDLTANKAPMALTNNGATFGADWLGASQSWVP